MGVKFEKKITPSCTFIFEWIMVLHRFWMLISSLKFIWLEITTIWLWFVRKVPRHVPTKQIFHGHLQMYLKAAFPECNKSVFDKKKVSSAICMRSCVLTILPYVRMRKCNTGFNMWCVSGNHGLGWKSKLFSRAKNVKKSEKAHFGKLQVRQAISQTLYELGTSGLAYSTHYNQYLMILHCSWLRMKSKLFSWAKNVKKWKDSFFRTPSSTSDFSDLIWARDFGVDDFYWLVMVSTLRFCSKIKINKFHPKPWFPKTHHI